MADTAPFWPEQAKFLVGVQIIALASGNRDLHPFDFIRLLAQMGLHETMTGCSAQSAPMASSCSGVEVGEKRGVIA